MTFLCGCNKTVRKRRGLINFVALMCNILREICHNKIVAALLSAVFRVFLVAEEVYVQMTEAALAWRRSKNGNYLEGGL